MEKHKVSICTGTTCFVMGGSELLLLEEQLPDDLKAVTEIEGLPCMSLCTQSVRAPFARVDGAVIEEATTQKIIEHIRGANA